MKKFWFTDPIYGRKVTVLHCSFERVQAFMLRQHNHEVGEDARAATAAMMVVEGDVYLWLVNDKAKPQNLRFRIVHEIVHIARRVMEEVGIHLSIETDEAYAYYQAYLYDTITTKLGVA